MSAWVKSVLSAGDFRFNPVNGHRGLGTLEHVRTGSGRRGSGDGPEVEEASLTCRSGSSCRPGPGSPRWYPNVRRSCRQRSDEGTIAGETVCGTEVVLGIALRVDDADRLGAPISMALSRSTTCFSWVVVISVSVLGRYGASAPAVSRARG
jgi:hypothetical protein